MAHKQPAKPSYFFRGGFIDFGKVIAGAFIHCGKGIVASLSGIGSAWSDMTEMYGFFMKLLGFLLFCVRFGFYLVRLISSAVVTPIVCLSVAAFQISILLVFLSVTLICFGIITLLDKIFCTIKAIVSHCPNCQTKFSMPMYICDCGREHDRLNPGYYGIFTRECECGRKLPTTFFNGRQRLNAQCPHCKCNIKDGGLHASWCIPVIGGPSSGKTCYINMTMMSLEKDALSRYGLRFEHEKNGLDEYEENADRLSKGYLPEKTTDNRLRYYQFSLTSRNATKQQISLCDVAGELFDVSDGGQEINKQIGFRYANAFILLIDPFSISEYRNTVSTKANLTDYKGSMQRIDEMLDTFIRTLQNMFSIDAKAMLNTDVAVVFTKADVPGLDEKIGESAVLKKASRLDPKARYETQNKLCEQFLHEYNEDNFLISLKSRFKSIQFFTCSALGHIMNGQPFVASNVEEPFFWIVRKRSKIINKTIKRGGKNK